MPDLSVRHIYLIGFSGSGKSTIGRRLAARMGRSFVDVDTVIERQCGMSITDVFAEGGERRFRKLESEAIARIAKSRKALVVALGGGAFERTSNRRIVERTGVSVYLQCSSAELYRRLAKSTDRPLLRILAGRNESRSSALRRRIKELLAKRRERYSTATITVSTTNRSVGKVVQRMRKMIGEIP